MTSRPRPHSARSIQLRLRLVAPVLGLAVLAAGYCLYHQSGNRGNFQSKHNPAPRTLLIAGSDAGYVDSTACAGCHRQIWERYRQTGMNRSFARAGPETVTGDFQKNNAFYHQASDRHYTMYRKDGKYYERRYQIGFDGRETNLVEKEIDYVIGSGSHARTFLYRSPSGRLFELPVAWYAEKGGRWGMNPGFDNPRQSDFRRQVMYECVFCHTGYPEIEPGADSSGREPLFPGRIPDGIDCQRCHGPGRKHIQAVAAGKPDLIRSTIVNPARLSAERQLELCMQCHLETTSSRIPHTILRFNRGAFSYRPGEPLADFALYFDHAPGVGYDDKFEIDHQAYRLRKSACFQKSGGRMTCTTCHEPHAALRGDTAAQHYIAVCRSCHAPQLARLAASGRHTTAANCLECHMPKRRTEDVVHVVMTDHYIQRRKPPGDLLAPRAERPVGEEARYKGPVVLYYPARLPPTPENELYQAAAQVKELNNLQEGIPRLQAALEKYPARDGEFDFELAEAYAANGQTQQAIRYYQEATRRKPGFRPAWVGLGRILAKAGASNSQRALDAFQEALALGPEDAAILNDMGLVYLQQGRIADALQALQKAAAADPGDPQASNNLGSALQQTGDTAAAEQAYRNAIRAQPDFARAHLNLANLLAARRDFSQAEYHYQKALSLDPRSAQAHQEYAAFLAGAERFREARDQFEAAVRLDPTLSQAETGLADMLALQGDVGQAIAHYRKALASDPELATAHLGLAAALAAQGRRSEAMAHLEKAARSADAAAREAAAQTLKAMQQN
jgi:predicted CXXCH cytochrome family protein